ncbi:cytochrome P450 [Amycolatopsis sp. NBC_00355]|uniref:cytochrome P450 n=1 Tax=Amycolatopsis sp. NBC_00355 TaxID=2975957 RepID=UPI002E25EEFA
MTEAPELPLHMRRHRFDPIEELAEVREGDGLTRVMTPFGTSAYLVTRYDDVREVLADSTRFSNAATRQVRPPGVSDVSDEELEELRAGQMLAFDPPDHTRLRKMLTSEFTVKRMRRLEPRIVEIVDAALDDLEHVGKPGDLVSTFALPVPSLVICELLGVPYSDRAEFQHRTGRSLDASLPVEQRMKVQRESREYMAGLVAQAQAEPGDDMLGMLVRKHGDDLSTAELIGIASLLLVAGHETTSNMLGLGTLALLRHPDQLAIMRDDPAAVEPAVEELLRWLSIVHSGVPRTTTAEVKIAGHTIPAGEQLVLALPAANRDPALAEHPERLDITREAARHVAFGHGVHHCLGAPLARMEMKVAFPALLRRFPDLALAVPYEEIEFRAFHVVYGLHALPVTW